MTIHVHLEFMVPPQHLGGPPNIHRRVQHHLPPRHVGEELLSVVGQLEAAEPSWEAEHLAGPRRLRAGLDRSRSEERAGVEDRHLGVGVVDGGDVGVSDVDGEDHLGVEGGEVELEGGEFDGDEVEGGVAGLGRDDERRGGGGRRADQGGGPAEIPLFAHGIAVGKFKDGGCVKIEL